MTGSFCHSRSWRSEKVTQINLKPKLATKRTLSSNSATAATPPSPFGRVLHQGVDRLREGICAFAQRR